MPRKKLKPREKRGLPDPEAKYRSVLLARFINKINFQGQKSLAQKIIYEALDLVKERIKEEPLQVFNRAIENCRPLLEVRPRRMGGATYQIPMEVKRQRSEALAMRWIIRFTQERKGKLMAEKLADELISASKKEGTAFKKREDTHKMAEANRAFAHYRW